MIWLLDGNALFALALQSHSLHDRTWRWFEQQADPFASCSVTEGTLLRMHMRYGADQSAAAAWTALRRVQHLPGHRFWNDGFSYNDVSSRGLTGGAQVTDAWLAELARRRGGKVATLDTGFAATHPDVAVLIPE